MKHSSIYFAQKTFSRRDGLSHDYSFLAAQSTLHCCPARVVKEMALAFPGDFKAAESFFEKADYRLLLIGIDFKIHPLLDRTFDPVDCVQFLLDESSVADKISEHPISEGLNLTKGFSMISETLGRFDANTSKAFWGVMCYGQDLVRDPILNQGWWSIDYITNGSARNR
jgi:hypothetical protein